MGPTVTAVPKPVARAQGPHHRCSPEPSSALVKSAIDYAPYVLS